VTPVRTILERGDIRIVGALLPCGVCLSPLVIVGGRLSCAGQVTLASRGMIGGLLRDPPPGCDAWITPHAADCPRERTETT